MRAGWGATEAWGTWTVDRRAELELPLHAKSGDRLVLNAFASAFLGKQNQPVRVRVLADGQQIAEWVFNAAMFRSNHPRWLTAQLPSDGSEDPDRILKISFEVDAPKSPLSEGLSIDPRTLGLGLYKLSVSASE
jgi:hypothetical protein